MQQLVRGVRCSAQMLPCAWTVCKGMPSRRCPVFSSRQQPSRQHSTDRKTQEVARHRLRVAAEQVDTTAAETSETQTIPKPNFKAFLDYKFIKDNLELVEQNCKNRKSSANPRQLAELYDRFLQLKQETEALRTERNANASAMKGKLTPEQRQALIAKGTELKGRIELLEVQLNQAEDELQLEGQRIPNLTHPSVPIGGEEVAGIRKVVGSQRGFDFEIRNHVEIGEALDLLDFEAAAEVSGSKFYYLRNAAALLEMALLNWALQKVAARGYTPMTTPDLVKEAVLEKCGFQPRGANTQVYSVSGSNLCLTGTAEVPLGGVYMDQILNESDLPIRMTAFGHCFRTEAGAAGLATRGLYRVHQFSKVEMFVLCTPEQSDALHEELISIEEELFTELGLHFKVLDMPSGDLGAPAYRKFDVEAWMPGLQRYGEISSASNCTDYQARRLNIRYRPASKDTQDEDGKKKKAPKTVKTEFVHTLNATACAVPRMIISILENFQQADGSITIPAPLRPYMAGMDAIRPKQSKH